jgi:hypothetical protein
MTSTNKELNREYLQNCLAELRERAKFEWKIRWPEPLSKEECLARFDALSDGQKTIMARRLRKTIEEYRKLLQESDLENSDVKYINLDLEERAFHIIGDELFESIGKTYKILHHDDGIERVFGLLPIGQFNAASIKPRENRGYIIAVNYGTFHFLGSLNILFNKFWDNFSEGEGQKLIYTILDNYVDDENPSLDRWERESVWDAFTNHRTITSIIKNCLDQHANDVFSCMMLQYMFVTFPQFGFPNLPTGFTQEEELAIWSNRGGLGARLMYDMLSFIISHEYMHRSHRLASVHKEEAKEETEIQLGRRSWKRLRSWREEDLADKYGFNLSYYATAIKCAHGDQNSINGDHRLEALMRAFLGACAFMSCGKLFNNCMSSVNIPIGTSHPPFDVRQGSLEHALRWHTSSAGKDADRIFRGMRSTAVIFERFISILWHLNKEKIISALLRVRDG